MKCPLCGSADTERAAFELADADVTAALAEVCGQGRPVSYDAVEVARAALRRIQSRIEADDANR